MSLTTAFAGFDCCRRMGVRLRRLRHPSCFAIDRAMPMRKDAAQGARLGDSSTVEQRTLTPSILVRIQVPQPNLAFCRFDALAHLSKRVGSRRFRKYVKGFAESGDHLAILPGAVR
jgi:hypothetical protein